MRRQVFPHAPSPTITSLRRISAIVGTDQQRDCEVVEGKQVGRMFRPRRRWIVMEIGCDVGNGDGSDVGRRRRGRSAPRLETPRLDTEAVCWG